MNAILSFLHTIFFGSDFSWYLLLEIIFRTSFMFVYAIANVRLMDKRSMGLLSPFEIIIIIALGSAIGDPMFYRNIPLIHGMVVISTIVFIERMMSICSMRSRMFERLISGTPVLLIKNGKLLTDEIKKQNFSKDELYSILRLRGVLHIGNVEYAYLEPSGSISIIKKDGVEGSELLPSNMMRG